MYKFFKMNQCEDGDAGIGKEDLTTVLGRIDYDLADTGERFH